ncbi:MAG: acyl-CoA/acyl-ACP dehydrogenase [Acidimicrobiales bacterium]|nr:acyl-CoA/acyl-ACP dehydrogenase [Acidimicrobiales bacterium]
MNFDLTDEQQAIQELTAQVFSGATSPETVEAVERSADRFDRDLWAKLAETGLLGVAVPEAHGGLGFGSLETALVLEGHGRSSSPMPLLETIVAARAIAAHGSAEQQGALLSGVADGSIVLSIALEDWGANDPSRSGVTASLNGDQVTLSGSKPGVAGTADAAAIVVSVDTGSGLAFALVDPKADGVSLTTDESTAWSLDATLNFDGTTIGADALFGDADAVDWAVQQAQVGNAAYVLGACEQAIATTVEHANSREQFGKPLAQNQAYTQRLASAAIDVDCIRVSVVQAAWLLDEGLPAGDEVLMAAWWASDAGLRVVHTTQHLHGGMGADITYPVHRHFLGVKQRAITLGCASSHLARLGARIAVAG